MKSGFPKIALVPINAHLGAFDKNRDLIVSKAREAASAGANLIVFPELALFGYHPMDLLERDSIVLAQEEILHGLVSELPPEVGVLVGAVERNIHRGKPYFNSAFLIENGKIQRSFRKQLLPVYDVFDDGRHFEPGRMVENLFHYKGYNFLTLICEDMWGWDHLHSKNPLLDIHPSQCDGVINLSASPYTLNKWEKRRLLARETVAHLKAPLFYTNMLGGQDELIFDGDCFVMDSRGKIVLESTVFSEKILFYFPPSGDGANLPMESNFSRSAHPCASNPHKVDDQINQTVSGQAKSNQRSLAQEDPSQSKWSQAKSSQDRLSKEGFYPDQSLNSSKYMERESTGSSIGILRQALVLGLRDFVNKLGFNKVHLGLSGGIDSAVVGVLAVEALGPKKVHFVGLPSPFNSPQSLELANEMADRLGAHWFQCSIDPVYNEVIRSFEKMTGPLEFSLVHENAQARIRGLLLMMFSNRENSLLLGTSNKSEFATGYTTLYGDMCSGLAVIGDLLKGQVYDVARCINKKEELIPRAIIDRPPSAELRPDQKDSDSLPSYFDLDKAVARVIVARGAAETDIEKWVLAQTFRSEFKRWQSPPILKVSDHAFGQGRRMPIAHRCRS